VTVYAREAKPGLIYRLTRDPGSTYYTICEGAAVRRLEKRLTARNVMTMTPEDRATLQVLALVRNAQHVLAVRVVRYRDDSGSPHEWKRYVAFPPDYPLREVAKPPSYGGGRSKQKGAAEQSADTDPEEGATIDDGQQQQEADDSRATG